MPKIRSYGTVTPYNSDFIIGTDRDISNVTRNYKVSKIVDIILASLGIVTVTSIATTSGTFVSVTGGTITTAGTITMDISATGTPGTTTFLRGDGTWSEPGPASQDLAQRAKEVESGPGLLGPSNSLAIKPQLSNGKD